MKKCFCIMLSVLLMLSLCACRGNFQNNGSMDEAAINLDVSSVFSKSELKEALKVVDDKFKTWPGFVMHTVDVSYAGEDVSYCNSLSNGAIYAECIIFESSFTTADENWSGFSANQTYKCFNWYVAREKYGKWQLVTYGVC